MHQAARLSLQSSARLPARHIAGRRFPGTRTSTRYLSSTSYRSFASSSQWHLDFTPPPAGPKSNQDDVGNSHHERAAGQPEDASERASSAPRIETETAAQELSETRQKREETKEKESKGKAGLQRPLHKGQERSTPYGSAARRWQRNRRPKEIPPINVPQWFLERNVWLHHQDADLTEGSLDLRSSDPLSDTSGPINDKGSSKHPSPKSGLENSSVVAIEAQDTPVAQQSIDRTPPEVTGGLMNREYPLSAHIYNEIVAFTSASFHASQLDQTDSFPASRAHLKLHCPVDGATHFLDVLLQSAGKLLNADLIRLDAQDIAETAGDYVKEGPEARSKALWTLAYDTQRIFAKERENDDDEIAEEDEEDDGDGEEDGAENIFQDFSGRGRSRNRGFTSVMAIPASGVTDLSELIKHAQRTAMSFNGQSSTLSRDNALQGGNGQFTLPNSGSNGAHQWNDIKLTNLLESLLEANQVKRMIAAETTSSNAADLVSSETPARHSEADNNAVDATIEDEEAKTSPISPPWPLPRTIIHIKGIKELSATPKGDQIMEKLVTLVQKKRKEGQQIIIVGTTASSDLTPELSKSGIEALQSEGPTSLYRTIVVTPSNPGPNGALFYHDEWLRNWEINCRNLRDMLRRLVRPEDELPRDLPSGNQVESEPSTWAAMRWELGESLLSFDQVHRLALMTLGAMHSDVSQLPNGDFVQQQKPYDGGSWDAALMTSMHELRQSDQAKTLWTSAEKKLQNEKERTFTGAKPKTTSVSEKRVNSLKSSCNKYEKRLLSGVVDPENLRTTFADVHAPVETIEALKNLTTLSLTRPEAFKYGVLATDQITGALLYGPPGTGKTLLAKAVAKESGATVLEVSGSDVYDMYVGEGEKNVRAIFSLAKKLSPCVVFIDEADAIFSSRGGPNSRNTHRELLNQFLREWDGMTDTNAFIMVATNRPFDLDDAALRRLPRRLLVDLPTEKDRAAILSIHLKNEQLDPTVSIAKLASETQLYSGSDLKNLAVAAALAAVREENDLAAKHREEHSDTTDEEAFKFPDRRVLTQKHFDKALEEITSSVSEDMGSLRAIKKFDEKYGDRRGRKKKQVYGFITGIEEAQDTAKVRS